jgi:hypothetical protein
MPSATKHRTPAGHAGRVVRPIALPGRARSLTALPRLDYTDSFLVATERPRDLTAHEWARVILEEAPPFWRRRLPGGWHALGLDHVPVGAEHSVLGWPIVYDTPDCLVLGAAGHRGLSAELFLERRDDGLAFATLLLQHNWAARLEWAAIAVPHRLIVSYLLERGVRGRTA